MDSMTSEDRHREPRSLEHVATILQTFKHAIPSTLWGCRNLGRQVEITTTFVLCEVSDDYTPTGK